MHSHTSLPLEGSWGLGSNTVRHESRWKWKSLKEWKSYRQKVTGCWFLHCTLYLWLRAAVWKNPSSGPVDLEIESSAGSAQLSALLPSTHYTRHARAIISLQRESCVSDGYFLSYFLKQHTSEPPGCTPNFNTSYALWPKILEGRWWQNLDILDLISKAMTNFTLRNCLYSELVCLFWSCRFSIQVIIMTCM